VTSSLRERATDQLGVVHGIVAGGWSLLTTQCGVRGQWVDRDFVATAEAMVWDALSPTPDVTCMTCMVKGARR
jgi:hypothetical protein